MYIVFVRAQRGPIAIGYSPNPTRHFARLQAHHYEDLALLGSTLAARADFTTMLRSVAEDQIRGAWYRPTRAVLAHAAKAGTAPTLHEKRKGPTPIHVDKDTIERALEANDRYVGRAAVALGISRRTLQTLMRKHELPKGRTGRRAVDTPPPPV